MGRLDGKVALVTGASRGIGRAIALQLAREGARLAVNFRSGETEAHALANEIGQSGGQCLVYRADVSDAQQARELVGKVLRDCGRLDVLVNNAGITRDKSLRKLTDEEWAEVLNTNLNSVFFSTTAAIKSMIDQQFGRIINISSFVGQAGNFGQANYAASKGAIIAFTKTAAIELAKFNITVNAIAPGFTLTDMLAKVAPEIQEQIKARIPMGRFGEPDEVAKVVVFVAADGDYITGQQINVNGGIYM